MADRDDARQQREAARRSRRAQPAQTRQDEETTAADGNGGEGSPLLSAAGVAAAGAAVGAALGAATAFKGRDGHAEEAVDESHDEEQPAAQAEAEPAEPEPEEPQQAEAPPEPAPQPEAEHPDPVEGASPDETAEVVRRARGQLLALHGSEPESISSLERTADGWRATFEVVELRRVPDSTDVLASYEVVLDGDLNVLRYARLRRYYRAQADHGEGA